MIFLSSTFELFSSHIMFPILTCQPPFLIRSTIVCSFNLHQHFHYFLNHAFAPSCAHTYGLPNSPKYKQQLERVPCLVICAHIDILKRLMWHYYPFQMYVEFGLIFIGFMIMLFLPAFFLSPFVHASLGFKFRHFCFT